MTVAIGTNLPVKSSTTQAHTYGFQCVLTPICYTESCLLFEFGLGKVIHAGAPKAELRCQEISIKKKRKIRTPQHRHC